jgi:hypothetical protein
MRSQTPPATDEISMCRKPSFYQSWVIGRRSFAIIPVIPSEESSFTRER